MPEQYTPEPWAAINFTEIVKAADPNYLIAVCFISPDEPQDIAGHIAAANARRIVATLNACTGIATQALESGALGELITACESEVEGLREQDALLKEALRQRISPDTMEYIEWQLNNTKIAVQKILPAQKKIALTLSQMFKSEDAPTSSAGAPSVVS